MDPVDSKSWKFGFGFDEKNSHMGKPILANGNRPKQSWEYFSCFLRSARVLSGYFFPDRSQLNQHSRIFQVLRFSETVIVADKKGLHVSSLYFSWRATPRLLFLLLRCWWMNVVKLLGETCLHTLMKVVKRNLKSLPKCQKLLKTYAQVIARSMGDASIALVFATTDLQQMTARYRSIKYQIFQCKLLIYLN